MSLFDSITTQPWLLTPAGFQRLVRDSEKRDALKPGATSIDIIVDHPREISALDDNGIAHISICGIIGHRLSWIEKALGNTDVCDVRREMDSAIEAGANGIFLRIDSPGGCITGTVELADAISEVSSSLPIIAYGDSCIASAGYWIACGSRQIWCSGSSEIGSIGILMPWIDKGEAWKAIGIDFQPITNADAIYKSAGHGPSLTTEQRDKLQEQVDRIYSMFQSFIFARRPNIDISAMHGQCFLGYDAVSNGLADQVGTLEEAYSYLCQDAGVFPVNVDLSNTIPITFPKLPS